MRRIVDERWPIRYAPYMSEESKDLVSRLLERKPIKRIGCFQGRAGRAGCAEEREIGAAACRGRGGRASAVCRASGTLQGFHQG